MAKAKSTPTEECFDISKAFITIFRPEIEQAIRDGKFPGFDPRLIPPSPTSNSKNAEVPHD